MTTRRRIVLCLGGLGVLPAWAGAQPAAPADRPQVRPGTVLRFPRDHGAHPDHRIEWWYATGWLQAPDAPPQSPGWGFQITFFRSRVDVAQGHPSRFAAGQLLFAHAALTDLARGRLLHDQRMARAGFGLAEAATQDTAVHLRDWRFERDAGSGRYRARVPVSGSGPERFGYALDLQPTQPLLLQGQAGYSRKGPDPLQASHYYSQPQLDVTGRLWTAQGEQAVRGRAWLDHEWSEELMHPDAVGWDWVGMNLLDGSALTAFRLRTRAGQALWAGGSLRRPGGPVRAFEPHEVRFEPLRRWASPASGATYPVDWALHTPAGTHHVRALLDAQELDSRGNTGAIYWEGLSELREAASGDLAGRGYLEMTGYAQALRL